MKHWLVQKFSFLELSGTEMLSGTFQNIVGLVINDKNDPTYTSDVLDDSLLVTVYVKLLFLAQYYACSMSFLCMSDNRLACISQHIYSSFHEHCELLHKK